MLGRFRHASRCIQSKAGISAPVVVVPASQRGFASADGESITVEVRTACLLERVDDVLHGDTYQHQYQACGASQTHELLGRCTNVVD